MKLRESEAQNWKLSKDINEFLSMDQESLIKHIEKDMMRNNLNGDILFDIINALILDIRNLIRKPIQPTSLSYPQLNLDKSFAETYISDVQQALCKDGWLCKKIDEISHLTIEEQVDSISNAIQKQEMLGRNRYKISSLATAVLILKIGITNFCGCFNYEHP